MRAALRRLLVVLLLAAWLGLAAGLLGRFSPLLDLANLIGQPLALLAAASALGLALMERWWPSRAVLAALALAAGGLALPPPGAPRACAPDAARLRIAWFNALSPREPGPIMAWLAQEQPEVIGFGELGHASGAVREALAREYPHFQSCLAHQRCSTILYARRAPLAAVPLGSRNPHNRTGLSAARLTIDLAPAPPLNLMAVHLSRPLPLGRQRRELAELEQHIRSPADTIIIGDFNATRRMQTLAAFAGRNGLVAAAADRPTWPLRLAPPWPLGAALPVIQIDQVLVGRNWAVERLRAGDYLGSDHRPLIADVCRRS